MDNTLREKAYFDTRATQEMAQHLRAVPRSIQETMAYACRILAMTCLLYTSTQRR